MDAKELLKWQLEHVGKQLEKVYEGLSEDGFDHKIGSSQMTAREAAEHLCDVYQASLTGGQDYSWGSYKLKGSSPHEVVSELMELRTQAVDAALSGDDEKALHNATEFLVTLDAYHVGQICASRRDCEADWDPYSIYQS